MIVRWLSSPPPCCTAGTVGWGSSAASGPILPEADLHRLRLMAKKQRYIADFFRGVLPRKATGRYIAALGQIQDVLGSLILSRARWVRCVR